MPAHSDLYRNILHVLLFRFRCYARRYGNHTSPIPHETKTLGQTPRIDATRHRDFQTPRTVSLFAVFVHSRVCRGHVGEALQGALGRSFSRGLSRSAKAAMGIGQMSPSSGDP